MMKNSELEKCLDNILHNFNLPGLRITDCKSPTVQMDIFVAYLDSASSMVFHRDGLLRNIKSPKDYRQLRRLVRMRLISATLALKHLAEETLRDLGV